MSDGAAVTLGDLLVENTDYGNFFPADIVPGTGLYPDHGGHSQDLFTLSGDALALVLAGSTTLYAFKFLDTDLGGQMDVEMMDFPGFNTYYTAPLSATNDS